MTASVSSGGMILTGEDKIGFVTYNVTLARWRNHCCYGQATVRSVYCWATVTVSGIKMSIVAQKWFYG